MPRGQSRGVGPGGRLCSGPGKVAIAWAKIMVVLELERCDEIPEILLR